MKPKIIKKDSFLIAGIAGSGDETAKAWEAFMKIQKLHPLKNQVGEEGYEVRMYPGEGPGKIHVGVAVKDARVPAEYKVFFVPAATYAEFEIYPAKGYESSNTEMSKWLEENAGTYRENLFDGKHYAIEIYDQRYKGDKNPASVVGILVPIARVRGEKMSKRIADQIQEIGGHIEEFAGVKIKEKVMAGSEKIVKTNDRTEIALWVKDAIDRLDAATTPEKCKQIMTACGYSCIACAKGLANGIRHRRQRYSTEEAFLKAEIRKPVKGIRLERKGNTLIHYYTPRTHSTPRRCFCGLMFALPEGVNTSPTYCQCSRGFVEKYWEGALGRPVKVEVKETCMTGADECKFIVHL